MWCTQEKKPKKPKNNGFIFVDKKARKLEDIREIACDENQCEITLNCLHSYNRHYDYDSRSSAPQEKMTFNKETAPNTYAKLKKLQDESL